jgi:thioredoxin reductase
MKRTIWLVATVITLLALTAVPALAEGGKQRHRWYGTRFALVGEVTAVNAGAQTFTVLVDKGNTSVEDYVGQELTIATGELTCYLRYGEPPFEIISFDDIQVGSYVGVNGHVLAGVEPDLFLAKRVMVDVPLPAEE